MKKIILLTTAITRGNLHKKSIGKFYEHLKNYFINYKIIHIINIDWPKKLRNKYNVDETKKILNEIIPENVEKYFIEEKDDEPNFAKAYNKVINCLHKNNLYNDDNLIWWLEDDWELIRFYNFTSLLDLIDTRICSALSITNNAPMCSFRGGPIMSGLFFKTFFDLSNKIGNCNPEEKVSRNIRFNRSVPTYKEDINIICIHILNKTNFPYTMNESCFWYYKRKYKNIIKFAENKTIKFILGVIKNENSKNIFYKINNNGNQLIIKNKNELLNLNLITIEQFKNEFIKSSINYYTLVPHLLMDIGRKFNKENNLLSPKEI